MLPHLRINRISQLRSSGSLRSEEWQFLADVSGQPIGPIFRRQESKSFWNIALLCYCPGSRGNSLLKFRDNLSVSYSKSKVSKTFGFLTPEMVPIGCPETSVRNCQYLLHNDPEERCSKSFLGS